MFNLTNIEEVKKHFDYKKDIFQTQIIIDNFNEIDLNFSFISYQWNEKVVLGKAMYKSLDFKSILYLQYLNSGIVNNNIREMIEFTLLCKKYLLRTKINTENFSLQSAYSFELFNIMCSLKIIEEDIKDEIIKEKMLISEHFILNIADLFCVQNKNENILYIFESYKQNFNNQIKENLTNRLEKLKMNVMLSKINN
ncbi:hypothetical protein [Campylobacter canadensis]|uniref:hypothetical protein n=1 Tax=Campylobacter canadensis TaxID=449520 RepID=UPI001CCBA3D9|nr:hypothetical protein [Campylobacter canadensis]MBZ8002399.1 hypothetical protein [Campylobacter canadensis]